jgi:two-component system sensor histidine kinase DctS
VLLNALQSNPADPQIGVRLLAVTESKPNSRGETEEAGLKIEIQDNGSGFSPEIAQRVPSPFFTTRNVGLGLGLTVTRKIIETHHGKLEIVPTKSGHAGLVRITLPMAAAPATAAPTRSATAAKQAN